MPISFIHSLNILCAQLWEIQWGRRTGSRAQLQLRAVAGKRERGIEFDALRELKVFQLIYREIRTGEIGDLSSVRNIIIIIFIKCNPHNSYIVVPVIIII